MEPTYKVYDCVKVVEEYIKEEGNTWRNRTYVGVITAIKEGHTELKTGDGTLVEIAKDKDYKTTIMDYSEIEYRKEIERAVKRKQNELESATDALNDVIAWSEDFNDNSIIARIIRWSKK